MIEQIVVEWKFEPMDYFEKHFTISYNNFDIEIKSGNATLRIDPKYIDKIDVIIGELNQNLESRFLAVQVLTHQKFNLSKPFRYDLMKDGKRIKFFTSDTLNITSSTSSVDLIIHNKNGSVLSDTKLERIEKKKWFSELSAKYRVKDQTLNKMLKSYSSSVSDPNNEMVHLYEIREAVKEKFGSENNAKSKLGITKNEWRDFGIITCNRPLLQGRHRGKNVGRLRQATVSELNYVRKIASKIIENYMILLEKK